MRQIAFFSVAVIVTLTLLFSPVLVFACGSARSGDVKMGVVPSSAAEKAGSYSGKTSSEAVVTFNAAGKVASQGDTELITFAVKGMTCNACERQVRTALLNQAGVTEVVEVSHKADKAVVKYDPSEVKAAQLASAVEKAGYTVEVIPAVARTGKSEKETAAEKTKEM